MKAMWRVLEKHVLRPNAVCAWDVVRAHVEVERMTQITASLATITANPSVQIIGVKDRFTNPRNGWADCSVYVRFPETTHSEVVAEIQLVHSKLMLVRENMGAHDAYSECRFFAEILRNATGVTTVTLPWVRYDEDDGELVTLSIEEEEAWPES